MSKDKDIWFRGETRNRTGSLWKTQRFHSIDKNRPLFQCNMKKEERSSNGHRQVGRVAGLKNFPPNVFIFAVM